MWKLLRCGGLAPWRMQRAACSSRDHCCGPRWRRAACPNPAPHAAQVRWYSFQFLCQTLSDELLDMHERMAAVLAALPKPPRPQQAPRAGRAGVREPLLPK